MDNMNNAYQSSSEIFMTPGAIQKLVNDIVSVVLEGTTLVYPRRETGILGNENPVNFMKYRPPHLKIQEGMINPTSTIIKELGMEFYQMEIIRRGNFPRQEPSIPSTATSSMLKTVIANI